MTNNSLRYRIVLLGIVLLGAFLRMYKLDTVPPSLNWDEAAFGYNAYSILKTGKDEYGIPFPRYFRSLDDYKLPVYTYLTAGSIAVLGYNDVAVRFPSALLGTLTVLAVYGLVRELAGRSGVRDDRSRILALTAAFFSSILPWNIQFSRMAAEANAGLFFLVTGIFLFLRGLRLNRWLLALSIISFGFSAYSYLSFRIVSVLVGVLLVVLYAKQLKKIPKGPMIACMVLCLFLGILLIGDTFFQSVHIRFKATSIFNTQEAHDVFAHKLAEMQEDAKQGINIPRRIFHDYQPFTAADLIAKGYLTHFSPLFLFFDYDQKQHHTPFVGLCYLGLLPFFLTGIYAILRRLKVREALLVLGLLLISPVPASVTWDIPHAIRAFGMSIPVSVFAAFGAIHILEALPKRRLLRTGVVAAFVLLFGVSAYYYFHQYMLHLPSERSRDWVYGRKEMTEYLEAHKGDYDRIVVSTSLEWPHIFLLYYSKFDPAAYIAQGGTKSGGFAEEGNRYGKYEFHRFRAEDMHATRTLFVGKPEEFQEHIRPIRVIQYLDGTRGIYIAEGDVKP